MMTWFLIAIFIIPGEVKIGIQGIYFEQEHCEAIRDQILATGPQPRIDYDMVCVPSSHMGSLS